MRRGELSTDDTNIDRIYFLEQSKPVEAEPEKPVKKKPEKKDGRN